MRFSVGVALAFVFLFSATGSAKAETLSGKVEVKTVVNKVKKRRPSREDQDPYGYDDDNTSRRKPREKPRDEACAVVVSVINAPKGKARPGGRMQQLNQTFIPFVLPVVVGSKVNFPNDDTIYHGVYSESEARPFELPQYAKGESRSLAFDKPGVVEIFCHIHAHMNAYIVVLETSFYAQPGEDHVYQITDLPPGKYQVKAWHPRLGGKVQMVEIKSGQPATLDFTL
jgi:plastocyanin